MSFRPFALESLEIRRLLSTVPAGFIDQAYGVQSNGLPIALNNGSSMEFAPDGRLFVLTQPGQVRIIDQTGTLLSTPAATLPVNSFFERGLLGIAFDPAFATNNFIYLYYTEIPAGGSAGSSGATFNRISRFTMTGNTINTASETLMMRMDQLSAGNHNGGAIHFGPDGMLYVGIGENANGANAQSISNRLGKLLRLNVAAYSASDPLAIIPADNPTSFPNIAGTTTGANRAIYDVGLRNPYTFTFHPTTGQLMINDVGQDTWEELNVALPGKNYGWSTTEGNFNQASFPNFTRPLYSYQHGSGVLRGNAVSGGQFYVSSAGSQFPAAYQGKYFFGDYVNNWIGYIDPASPPAANGHTPFASGSSGVVDLRVGPDGSLYYLQRGGTQGVRRIRPDPTQAPAIIDQPDNAAAFNGESVTFDAVAGGAATLSYQWTRNGVDIAGATSSTYTLNNVQAGDTGAQFRVRVSNSIGIALSQPATLTVTVDAAPVPTIATPVTSTHYTAGDVIIFNGYANDAEDGVLPAANLEWEVLFHHGTHTHPFFAPTSGITSGQISIPTLGETAANVFYRIHLRATDLLGRVSETFVDVLPNTANITLNTNIEGLALNLDNQPMAAPVNFTGVAGIIRNLDAPASQVIGNQTYEFQNWSDGQSANHNISTPLANTTYTAMYADVTAPQVTAANFAYNQQSPPNMVEVQFSENVSASLAAGDLVVTRTAVNPGTVPAGTMAVAFNATTNTARFTFPGQPNGILPDGIYHAELASTAATDSFGNPLVAGTSVDFFVLAGDANHDRSVNINDFAILAGTFGSAGRTFSQGDFNYSGDVNIADFAVLAGNFGASVPAGRPTGAGGDATHLTAAKQQAAVAAAPARFSETAIGGIWKSISGEISPVV